MELQKLDIKTLDLTKIMVFHYWSADNSVFIVVKPTANNNFLDKMREVVKEHFGLKEFTGYFDISTFGPSSQYLVIE